MIMIHNSVMMKIVLKINSFEVYNKEDGFLKEHGCKDQIFNHRMLGQLFQKGVVGCMPLLKI